MAHHLARMTLARCIPCAPVTGRRRASPQCCASPAALQRPTACGRSPSSRHRTGARPSARKTPAVFVQARANINPGRVIARTWSHWCLHAGWGVDRGVASPVGAEVFATWRRPRAGPDSDGDPCTRSARIIRALRAAFGVRPTRGRQGGGQGGRHTPFVRSLDILPPSLPSSSRSPAHVHPPDSSHPELDSRRVDSSTGSRRVRPSGPERARSDETRERGRGGGAAGGCQGCA